MMTRRQLFATLFTAPLVALGLRPRDDSAYLQSLLDHPKAGTVVFPPGRYTLSKMLQAGPAVRRLSAYGAYLVWSQAPASGVCFHFPGPRDPTVVEGLSMEWDQHLLVLVGDEAVARLYEGAA